MMTLRSDVFLTQDQRDARDLARRFARESVEPRAAQIDRDDEFPRDLYDRMAELGFLGLNVPQQYGGSGTDELTMALVMEEIARASGTVANALLLAKLQTELILRIGDPDQCEEVVPDVVAGRKICLIAVTEPDAGTDVSSVRTRAVKDGTGWRITGTKAFMTAGAVGDVAVVLARTSAEGRHDAFTTFLVPRSPDGDTTKGFVPGHKEDLMGMRGLATAGIVLDDTYVPDSAVLGKEGEGFRNVMRSFDNGRIVIACLALGLTVRALEESVSYSRDRQAFGRSIGDFQAVQLMLADMAVDVHTSRHAIHHAARMKDEGLPFATEASMAKLIASDAAARSTTNAVQVHGGYGFTKESVVERLYRDAKLTQIYEGTNQIQRVIIARHLLSAD